MSYKEALEVALCYGWIDGQKRQESEEACCNALFRAGARRPAGRKSTGKRRALALIASGEIRAAGLEAIENAKQSGRWESRLRFSQRGDSAQRFSSRFGCESEGERVF